MAEPDSPVVFLTFSPLYMNGYEELLGIDEETDRLRSIFERLQQLGLCELVIRQNVTIKHILDVVQDRYYRDRITIFHFAGHGDDFCLALDNSQREPIQTGAEQFAEFFKDLPRLRLVFLNVCCSQAHIASLQSVGIPYIITTAAKVPDDWSAIFAARFFTGVANGAVVESAFAIARTELQAEVEDADPALWQLSILDEVKPTLLLNARQAGYGRRPKNPFVRLDHFQQRKSLEHRINRFLESNDRGYFVLAAKAGMGKTTFLTWLAEEHDYAAHFGMNTQDAVTAAFTQIAQTLSESWGLEPFPSKVSTSTALVGYFVDAAGERDRLRRSEPIVIVLDGLDQIALSVEARRVPLPHQLPVGVYVICGTRPSYIPFATAEYVEELIVEEDEECWQENLQSVREHIENRLSQPAIWEAIDNQGLAQEEVVELIADRSEGLWIYLRFLFKQLENVAKSAGTMGRVDIWSLPQGIFAAYAEIFSQLHSHAGQDWQSVHLKLLGLLAAVRAPLPLDLICAIYPSLQRTQVVTAVRRLWLPIITVDNGNPELPEYRYYHDSLRDFASGKMENRSRRSYSAEDLQFVESLATAVGEAHSDIADYYLRNWGGIQLSWLVGQRRLTAHDEYGIENVLYHLATAQRYSELFSLVRGGAHDATIRPTSPPKHKSWLRKFWRRLPTSELAPVQPTNSWFLVRKDRNELGKYIQDLRYVQTVLRGLVCTEDGDTPARGNRFQKVIAVEIMLASIRAHLLDVPQTLAVSLLKNNLSNTASAVALTDNFIDVGRRDDALVFIALYCAEVNKLDDALQIVHKIADVSKKLSVLVALVQATPSTSLRHAQMMFRMLSLIKSQRGMNYKISLKQTFSICAPTMSLEQVWDAVGIVQRTVRKQDVPEALASLLKEAAIHQNLETALASISLLQPSTLQDRTRARLAVEFAQQLRPVEAWKTAACIVQFEWRRAALVECAKHASSSWLGDELWQTFLGMAPGEAARTAVYLVKALPFTLDQEAPVAALLSLILQEQNIRYRVPYLMAVLAKLAPEFRPAVEVVLQEVIPEVNAQEPSKRAYQRQAFELWVDQPLENLSAVLRERCVNSIVLAVQYKYERIMSLSDYETGERPVRARDKVLKRQMRSSEADLVIPVRVATICSWLNKMILCGLIDEAISMARQTLRDYRYDTKVVIYLTRSLLLTLAANGGRIVRAAISHRSGKGDPASGPSHRSSTCSEVQLCFELVACTASQSCKRADKLKQIMREDAFRKGEQAFFAAVTLIRTLEACDWQDVLEELVASLCRGLSARNLIILAENAHNAFHGYDAMQVFFENKLWEFASQSQTGLSPHERYRLLLSISKFAHKEVAKPALHEAINLLPSPLLPKSAAQTATFDGRDNPWPFVRLAELGDQEYALNLASTFLSHQSLLRFLEGVQRYLKLMDNDAASHLVFELIDSMPARADRNLLYNLYLPRFSASALKRYDPTKNRIDDADTLACADVMLRYSTLLVKTSSANEPSIEQFNAFLAVTDYSLNTFLFLIELASIVENRLADSAAVCRALMTEASRRFRGNDYLRAADQITLLLHPDEQAYEIMLHGVAVKLGNMSTGAGLTPFDRPQFVKRAMEVLSRNAGRIGARNVNLAKRLVGTMLSRVNDQLRIGYSELLLDAAARSPALASRDILTRLDRIRDKDYSRTSYSNFYWSTMILLAGVTRWPHYAAEQVPLVSAIGATIMEFGTELPFLQSMEFGAELTLSLPDEQWLALEALTELASVGQSVNVETAIAKFGISGRASPRVRAEILIILATSQRLSPDRSRTLLRLARELYGSNSQGYYERCAAHVHRFPASLQREICTEVLDWLRHSHTAVQVRKVLPDLLPNLSDWAQMLQALDLLSVAEMEGSNSLDRVPLMLARSISRADLTMPEVLTVLERFGTTRRSLMAALAGVSSLLCCISCDGAPVYEVRTAIRNAGEWWP